MMETLGRFIVTLMVSAAVYAGWAWFLWLAWSWWAVPLGAVDLPFSRAIVAVFVIGCIGANGELPDDPLEELGRDITRLLVAAAFLAFLGLVIR